MGSEKKVVKGGFRATLALIISIIAVILAFIAFNRTVGQGDLNAEIRDLRGKMEKMRKETSEKMSTVRQETKKALDKIGIQIEKEGGKE